MAAHTKVIPNNCVSEVKIPRTVESSCGVDYHPVLDLYLTFSSDGTVFLWNPVSGKVTAEFRGFSYLNRAMMFVPGNRIAVSSAEPFHGGTIDFYNLDEDEDDYDELSYFDFPFAYPGAFALSPGRNLLTTDAFFGGMSVDEIFIDWENSKVLKSRKIFPKDEDADYGVKLLCCSPDFKVTTYSNYAPILSSAKVCLNSEGKIEIQEQNKITYYMLNGEERHIDEGVTGLVYDGQNLITANKGEIVLLESTTEGSNAHLIASGVKSSGQIRLNHKGQLMVVEEEVVKLFDYKCNPRSLQDICRCSFRKTFHTDYTHKVNALEIPSILKNYLLFKY